MTAAGRRLLWLGKLGVTVALLVWVARRIDLGALGDRLTQAKPGWVLIAFALGAVNVSLGALRWRLVMQALGQSMPAGEAVRLYWSALFFNTFLPTGVVGDALRGAWAARPNQPGRGLAGVVLDRVTALLALVLVAAGALWLPAARGLPAAEVMAVACVALGLPAAVALAFPSLVPRMIDRVRRFARPAAAASESLGLSDWRPRLLALALGCLLHTLTITSIAALAQAAAVEVPLAILFAVIPAVLLSSFVPVSISGIGVRDAAMVELLGQAGVPAGGALALSIPFLAITMALSLVGGCVYLATGKRTP